MPAAPRGRSQSCHGPGRVGEHSGMSDALEPVKRTSIWHERDPQEEGHKNGDGQPQPTSHESANYTNHWVAPAEAENEDRGCREAPTNEGGNQPRTLRTRIGHPSPNRGNRENRDRKKQKRAKTHAEGRFSTAADRHTSAPHHASSAAHRSRRQKSMAMGQPRWGGTSSIVHSRMWRGVFPRLGSTSTTPSRRCSSSRRIGAIEGDEIVVKAGGMAMPMIRRRCPLLRGV
jgi:hypothetical protein